jgi:hypothetical protein
MPHFIINRNKKCDPEYVHVIHDTTVNCGHLPKEKNQIALGWHSTCFSAIEVAKDLGYESIEGCTYCCEEFCPV